jgi:hypothetical protein
VRNIKKKYAAMKILSIFNVVIVNCFTFKHVLPLRIIMRTLITYPILTVGSEYDIHYATKGIL